MAAFKTMQRASLLKLGREINIANLENGEFITTVNDRRWNGLLLCQEVVVAHFYRRLTTHGSYFAIFQEVTSGGVFTTMLN